MDAVTHAYGRCGDYTARLEVEDDLGDVGDDSVVISVSNVNPSVTLFPPDPIDPDEGDTVTFDGYFDDPSWLDEHTAEWDFGDGQTASGSFQPGVGYTHHEMDEIEHVYGHGGDYIVTLTIWDDCSGMGNASMEISISNVAPSVSMWAIPSTADEGENITFDGYFDDPSWLDNHTATWDFGDGSPTEPGTFSPGWGDTHHEMDEVTHAYGKAGVYQVTLTVQDDMGGIGTGSVNVTIVNVPPTVSMWAIPPTADEGENITFDGYFDDPSWLDNHTATWDFGDGSPTEPGTFSPGVGYTHHEMDEVTHAYGKAGIYEVTLTVDDNLGGVVSDSVNVTIVNVPPTVLIWAIPPTADEGDDITFDGYFDDPSWLDNHTATWDFGDGSTTEPGTFYPGVGYTHHEMDEVTHAYGKAGVYQATLTIDDNLGGITNDSVNVTIVNVPPTVSMWAIPPTADEGDDITFDGYFDDPSWLDEHTATWDFGDGTPTVPGTFYPGVGYTHHEMDEVTHAYGKAGVYQVTLTIDDNLGGITSDGVTVTILNVVPTVTAAINTTNIQEGLPFTVSGSFYDPSWNDTFDDVYFDFGYNDTTSGLYRIQDRDYWPPPGPGNVTHEVDPMDWVYGDDGNYTIYLNVTDEFGGSDSDSVYVNVYNVAPTVINITVILHQNAPRTHGYWKHQCKVKNPKQDHPGIRQEWIDAIRSQSMVFTDVTTKDDVCSYLDPDTPMTPMKRAKMQLMALWLNVVSGLLWIDSPLHHPGAPGDNSVADFITHAEWLILTNPTDPNLNWVATIACDINEDADGQNDWSYVDPVVGEYIAHAYDPGTDDLMFVWEDGVAITGRVIHYKFNDGVGPEPDYDPGLNEVKTPWGIYPFVVVDRFIVGYPPNSASGVTAELVCLKDDDGGQSLQANKDCSDPWGSGMMAMGFGPDGSSVNWTFEFDIDYRSISGGFVIAEVEVMVVNHHPLAEPIIVGGRIEE
jgi:PKD repeat protein